MQHCLGSVHVSYIMHSAHLRESVLKRNRNIIVETIKEVKLLEDYCWLTLAQIHKLIGQDNIVNMDARSVLSCISFAATELKDIDSTQLNLALKKLDAVDESKIPTDKIKECQTIGISSGASAPEILVQNFINELKKTFVVKIEKVEIIKENIIFKTPAKLN